MKLGEMLVRDGRITSAQLQLAMAHQGRSGGRIGSILVELGHLDAETLTVYLGLELGMPIATGATLERCKRSAVRLLTPQQAARYRCVPIVIQGQTLILAIEDPLDMRTLDALHNMTGYRVLPRVAPEIRIHYYLERFYGVPRPTRLAALGDGPRGNPTIGSHTGGLPGPPLPGLPPRRSAPISAPTPRPTVRRAATQPPERSGARPPPVPAVAAVAAGPGAAAVVDAVGPPEAIPVPVIRAPTPIPTKEEQEALEIDANDLVVELDADEADVAGHVTAPVGNAGQAQAQPRAAGQMAASPPPGAEGHGPAVSGPATEGGSAPKPDGAVNGRNIGRVRPMLTRDAALTVMATTDERGAVADAIVAYAGGLFEVAVLCLVRDHMALGWKGFGPHIDEDRIEALLVPLEMPSIYHLAARSREMFRGHAFPAALHDHMFKVLRCHSPLYSVVAPITIGQRVVNLLYGHKRDGGDLTEKEALDLQQVADAAGQAYVRLISASKAQRGSA